MRVGNEGQRREGMLVLDPVKEVWAALLSLYLLVASAVAGGQQKMSWAMA